MVEVLNNSIENSHNAHQKMGLIDLEKFITSQHLITSKIHSMDAIAILTADHEYLTNLFLDYKNAETVFAKEHFALAICAELLMHTQVEEEIFYPMVKSTLLDAGLLDAGVALPEPIIEYEGLKALIADIEAIYLPGNCYDDKINFLAEYVKHHVKEDHEQIFPRLKLSNIDLKALGQEIAFRKLALTRDRHALISARNKNQKDIS